MFMNQLTPVRSIRRGTQLALMLIVLLLVTGCGGLPPVGQAPTSTPTPMPTSTPLPTPTPGPTSTPLPQAISNHLEANKAVVRIAVRGAYSFYEEGYDGERQGEFGGSGFIIDPDGLVVTNSHVVVGATTREVYIPGEDEPRRAELVGVAECSDLALLDIEGEGFPYFDWFDDDVTVGMEVYAAGYPLSDEEYTLTEGIISKAAADGASPWASVSRVLEHTATLNPGNSGGPLFNEDGVVVGVNYSARFDASQYFAISAAEAQEMIADIQNNRVTPQPIGLRARAFALENASGIWVESVTAGEVADKVGLEPGDIITKMGGLSLAADGTLTDYCEILTDRGTNGTLDIEVLRPGQAETDVWQVFEGQIDGRELEVMGEWVPSYEVADESEKLALEVPTSWTFVDGTAQQLDDGQVLPTLVATPNRAAFLEGLQAPGVMFMQFPVLNGNPVDVLEIFDYSSTCRYLGREDYQDNLYTGVAETWTNCGGTNTSQVIIAFVPSSRSYVGLLRIQLVGENDDQIRSMIERSFVVNE